MSLPAEKDGFSRMSEEVIVRVAQSKRSQPQMRTGVYLYTICEWLVAGISHPHVIEWWPMPTEGTGEKP